MTERLCLTTLAAALVLAACQGPGSTPADPEAAASPLPVERYRSTIADGGTVYRLDPSRSYALFLVRRSGPLARLGHDHGIRASGLRGFLGDASGPVDHWRADLEWRVADIEVDPPDLRQRFRLDTEPDAEDIAGTRRNLLRHVLVAERWPVARLEIADVAKRMGTQKVSVLLTLNAVTRTLEAPVTLTRDGDGLLAAGRFSLLQSDWGIEPFSALGGALRVADEVEVFFQLVGTPWRPDE